MVNIILFLLIGLFLLFISALWPPDSPWAPWWSTSREKARQMCRMAKVKKGSVVYDLGCGTGEALIVAATEFGATCVGIEIDPFRVFLAKYNVRREGMEHNVNILKENFFALSLSDATVVFVYLIPRALMQLSKKMMKELKPGTILVSYRYQLPLALFKGQLVCVKRDYVKEIYVYSVCSVPRSIKSPIRERVQ